MHSKVLAHSAMLLHQKPTTHNEGCKVNMPLQLLVRHGMRCKHQPNYKLEACLHACKRWMQTHAEDTLLQQPTKRSAPLHLPQLLSFLPATAKHKRAVTQSIVHMHGISLHMKLTVMPVGARSQPHM